jgi:hypothetical protein
MMNSSDEDIKNQGKEILNALDMSSEVLPDTGKYVRPGRRYLLLTTRKQIEDYFSSKKIKKMRMPSSVRRDLNLRD